MTTGVLYREIERKHSRVTQALSLLKGIAGLDPRSKYTWVITQDQAPHESGSRVIHHGPNASRMKLPLPELVRTGHRFRLLDRFGTEKMSGFIAGKFKGPEPLDEYGRQFGCTVIEYERKRKWMWWK